MDHIEIAKAKFRQVSRETSGDISGAYLTPMEIVSLYEAGLIFPSKCDYPIYIDLIRDSFQSVIDSAYKDKQDGICNPRWFYCDTKFEV